jgi:hypothetical protein
MPKMKKMVVILKRRKKIKMLFFGSQTNHLDMRKTDSIIKNAFKRFYTKQTEIYCFGSKNPQNPLYFNENKLYPVGIARG